MFTPTAFIPRRPGSGRSTPTPPESFTGLSMRTLLAKAEGERALSESTDSLEVKLDCMRRATDYTLQALAILNGACGLVAPMPPVGADRSESADTLADAWERGVFTV